MNIHPPGDEHAPVRVWRHIRGGKAFHPSGPDPLPARGQPSTHPGEIPRTTGRGPAPARVIRPTRAGADRHPLGCMDLPGPVQQHIRSGLEHPPSGCKAASAPTSGYFLSYRRHGSLNGFRALARRHLQGHSASGPGLAACGGCGSWPSVFSPGWLRLCGASGGCGIQASWLVGLQASSGMLAALHAAGMLRRSACTSGWCQWGSTTAASTHNFGRTLHGRSSLSLQRLLCVECGHHLLAGPGLQFKPRHLGYISSLPRHFLAILESLRVRCL